MAGQPWSDSDLVPSPALRGATEDDPAYEYVGGRDYSSPGRVSVKCNILLKFFRVFMGEREIVSLNKFHMDFFTLE